jgi:hypothetical protein
MYPRRTLDPEDLFAYSKFGAVVTIEKIDFNPRHGLEGAWMLTLREINKPVKLTAIACEHLAKAVGSEKKADWIGKVIRIHGIEVEITDGDSGEQVLVWTTDVNTALPTKPPVLAPYTSFVGLKNDPARAASLPGADERVLDMTPIGRDVAIELLADVMERGIQCSVVAKSIGSAYPELGELHPLMLNTWPAAALDPTRRFIRSFPKCQSRLSRERLEREIGSTWDTPAESIR